MAIGANSYGTLAGVGALVPKFSGDAGDFGETDRPSGVSVENWIDGISGMVNSTLAQEGFAVPVTQADVVEALRMFVEQEVVDLVYGINGSGRFGPTSKQTQRMSRWKILTDDVMSFVSANAFGFELLGATRSEEASAGIQYRDTDESGDEMHPIFQREAFGNVFQDWDA